MRVVVLASGSGTLLRALLDACAAPEYPARVVAVGVDRECAATGHAEAAGVPHFRVALRDHPDRAAWDAALADAVAEHEPDLVVSAGFMKILGPAVLKRFPDRIINTHPALLPAFPGAHGVRDALSYGVKITGCTVHLVDEGVDTGPILAQEAVAVLPGDDEPTLHERIKAVERRLLVDTIPRAQRSGRAVVWTEEREGPPKVAQRPTGTAERRGKTTAESGREAELANFSSGREAELANYSSGREAERAKLQKGLNFGE